ncbi:50S ribosomal protein L29 [Polystyrenella longa]|uniref:Large ribosomal subunit protein uL29 n=1 Tax=Polystyrenella longa TaxID=2528007 RepID=A0A518CR88_9PLAN|nr:50S ribosomal protein L29 [Polystyrenella longa]QDU81741.1 50S ribosomal protein L29 [Polystyrenella longa]
MSTAAELREMNEEQLNAVLTETQKELFQLRFQSTTEKLEAPSELKKMRREVARIKTIQSERLKANS